jgi:SAM-dependent methyltransferase
MEKSEYANIYRYEKEHFYYRANREMILSLIKKYLEPPQDNKKPLILDAGCGTGFLAKELMSISEVIGIDIDTDAIKYTRRRGVRSVCAPVEKLPFKNKTFDAVVSMDVIYHRYVQDDAKAISEMFRVLKPHGILVIRVPAHKWLLSNHDKVVYTKRRYSITELKNLLKVNGFTIQQIRYTNSILFPIAVINMLREKLILHKQSKSIITKLPGWVNSLLYFAVSKFNAPFGLGLVAVAQKCIIV